ncbi:MAG: tetratricopeptide repeat protein, partial [Planctomycetota bacterium]|jgi:tetratricopeptide (TPR) repeat protein
VFVVGRYKLPFMGLLAVFGGSGVVAVLSHVRARRLKATAACCLMAMALAFAFWPRQPADAAFEHPTLLPNDFTGNAAVLMSLGRTEEAVSMLEDGASLFPRDPRFLERLAGIALRRSRPAEALAYTERALAGGLVTEPVLERRAIALVALSRNQQARETARELLRLYPHNKLAKRMLAEIPPR